MARWFGNLSEIGLFLLWWQKAPRKAFLPEQRLVSAEIELDKRYENKSPASLAIFSFRSGFLLMSYVRLLFLYKNTVEQIQWKFIEQKEKEPHFLHLFCTARYTGTWIPFISMLSFSKIHMNLNHPSVHLGTRLHTNVKRTEIRRINTTTIVIIFFLFLFSFFPP